ncbi:hypothetical protein F0562_022308 [Nyssa sinensis]|uniref:Uncharacterized protein n=1 Tax=Nyssa sinensis TaxID=561372 RepID=A0A5J5BNK8_9ASTE|nr:hypothetical protein F0562_022308 [Nyssa sinensis]
MTHLAGRPPGSLRIAPVCLLSTSAVAPKRDSSSRCLPPAFRLGRSRSNSESNSLPSSTGRCLPHLRISPASALSLFHREDLPGMVSTGTNRTVVVIKGGKGVGEERPVAGGKGGDELVDLWVVGGGPGVVADVSPEFFFRGERVKVGRCAAGGGESWAVESGQDVCLKYVGMDGGDRRVSALIDGGSHRG